MKKIIMAGLLLAIAAGMCAGQTYWKRTYGPEGGETRANAIALAPDGNLVVAGVTHSGSDSIYMLKIKPNGDILWARNYGGTSNETVLALTPTSDGKFIAVGETFYPNDVFLMKVDSNGDSVWTRTYHGKDGNCAEAIVPTSDGNFIVTGYAKSTMDFHVYLLKIGPGGDTLWTKTYDSIGCPAAAGIISTSDGDFLIAGNAASTSDGGAYLMKIKPNGDTVWTRTYKGTYENISVNALIPTHDGNFIVAGSSYISYADHVDVYLLKTKADGGALWTKTYEGNSCYNVPNYSEALSIAPATDGNFISAGGSCIYLLKINPDGDTLWSKTNGGTGSYRFNAISPAVDGDFVLAGQRSSSSGIGHVALFLSLIDDKYAYKSTPFFFKIPVSGDSVSHGYTPLMGPDGMTVSLGGTISWTPTTDSSYMGHVEFLVTDDFGKKDTLTFNIFVNSKDHPTKAISTASRPTNNSLNDLTVRQLSPKEVRFSLPAGTKSLGIYDVRGQVLENISVKGNQAAWRPKNAAGRYFAKAIWEKREAVKGFTVIK